MPARSDARHRAARRPLTALDDLATASTDGLATVGKRSAAALVTSGLVMSMTGAPAFAAHSPETGSVLGSVDTARLTQGAREVLAQSVIVTSNVEWTADIPPVIAVVPPPPAPKPAPSAPTSRARERAAAPSAPAAAGVPAATAVVAPASANGSAIVEIATRYVGVPYVYGGSTPDGFDCSGFTSYVFAQVGISLPRTSSAQRNVGTVVSRADAQPGDLIWSPGHIAIYAGGNLQIDSPRPGKTIQVREIWQSSPTFIRVG